MLQPESKNDRILIRLARDPEFEEVGALVRSAYEGDYVLDADYLAEIEDVRGRAAHSQVWLAEEDGRILGTVTTPLPGRRLQDDTEPGEMDLRLLGVAREARGRGVARRLVTHCIELARARGASRLVLHTASTMTAPQRLYERMGFERIPEREYEFVRSGETLRLLAYALRLSPLPAGAAPVPAAGR